MDRNNQSLNGPNLDGIDKFLASEEEIVPSSGFLASVMERVEAEATTPAPIAFPWKRALAGFVLAAVVFVGVAVQFVRLIASSTPQTLTEVSFSLPTAQTQWIALAIALTLASAIFVRKLVSRSESL